MESVDNAQNQEYVYRGRIAPSPSGHLHVGHAQTFSIAMNRAKQFQGKLVLRVEDIDLQRCKPHYLVDMIEDLTWFGIRWDEGYGIASNDQETYQQRKRFAHYIAAWQILYEKGYIYPCTQSRRDVAEALSAPHDLPFSSRKRALSTTSDGSSFQQLQHYLPLQQPLAAADIIPFLQAEPIFPITLRLSYLQDIPFAVGNHAHLPLAYQQLTSPIESKINWRFRIPDCKDPITFQDGHFGSVEFVPGEDFGDFLVWRSDGYPAYELAVIVDDLMMQITEVVRGEDLLVSTARQLLLMQAIYGLDFRKEEDWHPVWPTTDTAADNTAASSAAAAIRQQTKEDITTDDAAVIIIAGSLTLSVSCGYKIPRYYHVPLLCDATTGRRLAKRNLAKSLRRLREEDLLTPEKIKEMYFHPLYKEE